MNDKSVEGCFCEQAYCEVCEKMGPRAGKRIAHLAEQSENDHHFPVLPIELLGELLNVLKCEDHENYEY